MMWLQSIITIYHLHSFRGSDIQERRGWAPAQGLSEAASSEGSTGVVGSASRTFPHLVGKLVLAVSGRPTSSPSGLFPALLECSYNMMTREEGEGCVCGV